MAKNPNWSKEEDEFLISNYKNGDKNYILSVLSRRNWTGITVRANKLMVYRLNYFTESEVCFLKNNWDTMSSKQIAEHIGRSVGVVKNKLINVGIIRQEQWSEEDCEILKEYFGKYDIEYIATNILKNRTKSSIYHQCQWLGLSKKTNRYTKEDLLFMLKNLSEELERTPISQELSKYGLPCSSTYVRFFGSYHTACEILGLDLNATIFNQTKCYFSKNMDECHSKSEQIITNFLIDNNIQYKMDKRYSLICKIGQCGKKRYDWLINGNVIVEYFGLDKHKKYQKRMKEKIELCELNNIELIQIFDKDILNLDYVFEKFL